MMTANEASRISEPLCTLVRGSRILRSSSLGGSRKSDPAVPSEARGARVGRTAQNSTPQDLPFGGCHSTRPAILSSRQTDGRRIEMGKLIATTQATVDGVIDPVGEWVQADGDHGDYSFERQARSGGLVLGRKTYEGLAGYWPSQSGKWADMVNPMPKYVGSRTLS